MSPPQSIPSALSPPSSTRLSVFTGAVLMLALALPVLAQQKTLYLELGDADRRGREADVLLDAVVDTRTGDILSPGELAARLAKTRLIFIGENHTDMEFHRVQLRVIEELHRAGREVIVGLEMYPVTEQEYLTHWSAGHLTEDGFIELSKWYESWSQNWLFYRDIFVFARDKRLPMIALNAPRDVVRAVRSKGFDGLSEDEKQHVPPRVDLTDSHRTLFKSYFDEDDPLHSQMSEEMWDGMIRAQATWDGAMGYNAVQAIREHENAVMVVLIGSGHVAYGLGIEHQAAIWIEEAGLDAEMASIIPVPITNYEGEPIEKVSASYADFIWGVPASIAPVYPVLGLSTSSKDQDGNEMERGRRVIFVSEESSAEAAGFQTGDLVLTMDGVDITPKGTIGRLMGSKHWGDRASWTVLRNGEETQLNVQLRRPRLSDD